MTTAPPAPSSTTHPGASTGSTVEGAATSTVALADVAAHPLNPRGPIDPAEVTELAGSILELGILEPVVLLPIEAAAAAWAALDDAAVEALTLGRGRPWPDGPPPDVTWVILAGHCRSVAAGTIGLDRAPAIVREDLAADPAAQIAAMAAENIGRTDLPPLAEARSFAVLAGQGWSQRRIAATAGCSPSHVHKRISLTRLPEPITTALEAGTITVSEAMEFTALDTAELAAAAWSAWHDGDDYQARTPAKAVEAVTQRAKVEAARLESTQRLADEGLEVIDPRTRFPRDWWEHQVQSAAEVKRARAAGTLVAAIDGQGGINYFTTKTKKQAGSSGAQQAQAAESRERGRAMKARIEVCARIAQAGPPVMPSGPARALADTLAIGLLDRSPADAGTLALKWLHPDPTSNVPSHPYPWTTSLLASGTGPAAVRTRITVAYALALALDEVRARWTHAPWTALTRAYLQRLQDAGYEPTPWELDRLARIRAEDEHQDDVDPETIAPSSTETGRAAAGGWLLTRSAVDGWSLWRLGEDQEIEELLDSAGVDIGDDEVDAAQAWAGDYLGAEGHRVLSWQSTTDQPVLAEEGWVPTLG